MDDDKHAKLYVVEPENEGVRFAVDGSTTFHAASSQQIKFTFTAVDTPIKDGTVQFSIPSSWDKGVKSTDDVLGQVTVSGGPDHDDDLTVSSSGRSITVKVKKLNTTDAPIVITYGGEAKKAIVQDKADTVDIKAYYWASSGSPRRGAGTVEFEITNVRDGDGIAEITPTTVKAGSIDETFTITFEADGTMDGGAVSLERPGIGVISIAIRPS